MTETEDAAGNMAMTVFARRSRVDSSGGGRQNFMENSNVLGGGGVVGGGGRDHRSLSANCARAL